MERSTTMTSPAATPSPASAIPGAASAPSHRRVRRFKDAPLELVRHIMREPGRSATFAIALAKGHLYKAWYRARGLRLTAGRGLAIYGRLSVRGPGTVTLGHDVAIYGRVNAWTYGRDARITIGDNVMMSGAKIGCAQEVHIGRDCIVAESSIRDTDFHSVRVDRRRPEAPIRVAPVRVEDNVWIASQAILLPGTTIGRNCVVGAAAVCMRAFPADKVILGNPAKVAMPVPTAGGDAPSTELATDVEG